jgi:hypothetical protein
MATFNEVFLITWKVLLALFLISLGLSVGYFVLYRMGNASIGSTSESHQNNEWYIKTADEKHTRVPLSVWNSVVNAAIKQHCALVGMSKEDAEKSLGKPQSTARDSSWEYERTVQKECKRYEGETCAEYEMEHEYAEFHFTPSGHLIYPGSHEGGWLHMNCFEEPFYSRYYKLLPD